MKLLRAVGDVVARRNLNQQKPSNEQTCKERDAELTHVFLRRKRVRRDSTLLASQPALVSTLAGSFRRGIRSRECPSGKRSRSFAHSRSPEFLPAPSAPQYALSRASRR